MLGMPVEPENCKSPFSASLISKSVRFGVGLVK